MNDKNSIDDNTLTEALAKKGYEYLQRTGGSEKSLRIEANKLEPVYEYKGRQLFVPVSTSLLVTMNDKHQVSTVEEADESSAAKIEDAKKFVETLIDNNQLGGLTDSSSTHTTHVVETDESGKSVVMRRGFSAY